MTNADASGRKDDVARVFVQTARSEMPALDRWSQMSEEEARVAYEMTLRNELSGGTPVVRAFESEWRSFCGQKYALTTFNGTSALYSAFFGLGVGPGDEVLCPTYTWICTISPVPFLGARPVFCESDPRTMMADPDDIRRRITPRTRAIVVVHLWGWVCDMDAVMELSRETGIPVVEDCAHAHGARYKGRPVGSFGHAACWSLQGSKPVSGGEGGVLATSDTDVYERACIVGQVNRIVGMDLATERYAHLQPLGAGMKFRAHPVAIGIAQVQLRKLPELNRRRRMYVEAVEAGLADLPFLEPVATYPGTERGGFYGFPVRFRSEGLDGADLELYARACEHIGLKVWMHGYELLHRLPYFAQGFDLFTRGRGPLCGDYRGWREGDFPATEAMHRDVLFLPVLSDPVDDAAEQVLDALRRAAELLRGASVAARGQG